jgi:hypothetical protein
MVKMVEMGKKGAVGSHLDHPVRGRKMVEMGERGQKTGAGRRGNSYLLALHVSRFTANGHTYRGPMA